MHEPGSSKLSLRRGREFSPDDVPRISPRWLAWFTWYVRRYLRRHFSAIRIAIDGLPPQHLDGPVIVALNHPGWWDPLVSLALAQTIWPDRRHFAPIDSAALERYRFFQRLGFFGIAPGTADGARTLLRRGRAILARPDSMLWITVQGEFTDPRQRPVIARPGVGHLLSIMDHGCLLPLALEYAFWTERTPEALACFGKPCEVASLAHLSPAEWTAECGERIESAQDQLADDAQSRDPRRFSAILDGTAGVGGVYDLWRRLKFGGQKTPFDVRHSELNR